jgi:hypothetical protein
MKYTLSSDRMTEVHKTIALDIPVIQPFHASFDILPLVAEEGGMPDPFAEGEFMLNVRQAWLLTSAIGKLGSEMLEVRHIGVEGNLEVEGMALEIKEGKGCSSDEGLIGFTPFSEADCSVGYGWSFGGDDVGGFQTGGFGGNAPSSSTCCDLATTWDGIIA